MLKKSRLFWSPLGRSAKMNDGDKDMEPRHERGNWTYDTGRMSQFSKWCKTHDVKAYNNVKISSDIHFARCLKAARTLHPGSAVITAPVSSCFNFLTAVQEMYSIQNNFPMRIDWMNWNTLIPYLPGSTISELGTSGWMCRTLSLEEEPFFQYFQWLIDDSRGKDGISVGFGRAKGEENPNVDYMLSLMTSDACDEPESFMSNLFLTYAAMSFRSIPADPRAVDRFARGTDFTKLKPDELFVPTLVPLVDCVPHREDGQHNCLVDFFLPQDLSKGCLDDLGIVDQDEFRRTSQSGVFVLRPLQELNVGDVLYIRGFPKTTDPNGEMVSSQVTSQAMGMARNGQQF